MNVRTWLRQGAEIARVEWTRQHREFGSPLTGRPVLLVVLIALAVGLGWLGRSLGRDFAAGQPLPDGELSLLASLAFVWLAWRSSQYTQVRIERLNP
ncbi:MAG TPA: hypothetical protein VKM69_00955, partial [Natronoarchaeum rubrum]|nr:hypothetical protein [Natronoarchaeum rubrum]